MITLITGAPGAGKTAALVQLLTEIGQNRALYVHGIPDLKLTHFDLQKPEDWMAEVPDGAAIIIDEVQNVWRPRAAGSKVPDHVAALETHRHRGLDFFIITQGPNLLDSNVRALVGRHVHLRDLGFLGRWWYEWPECSDNVRTGWRSAPIKKRYRLPKKIFGQYKSASVHVKPVRSFPVVLLVLVAALIGAAFLSWRAYSSVRARISGEDGAKPALVSVGVDGSSSVALGGLPSRGVAGPPDERVDFLPRIAGRPWTSPAYDELRQVVAVPHITGGMCVGGDCRCFSGDQRLMDVSSSDCNDWIETRPFNPYVLTVSGPAVEHPKANGYQSPARNNAQPVGALRPSML